MGTQWEEVETLLKSVAKAVNESPHKDKVLLPLNVVLGFVRCPIKYTYIDSMRDEWSVWDERSVLMIDLFRLIYAYVVLYSCTVLPETVVHAVRAYADPDRDLITARAKFEEAQRKLQEKA